MKVINFETAKILFETFPNLKWKNWDETYYIYTKDTKELLHISEQKADEYLINKNFYPAPIIQSVIDFLEKEHKWSIYITPRFDGWDNAQIDTYYEIYKTGCAGGKDYSSDAHVGDRWESANRAIIEVCNLIKNE